MNRLLLHRDSNAAMVSLWLTKICSLLLVFAVALIAALPIVVTADVWVFEPTAAIDQRFDDNYRLDSTDELAVSATRAVGTLGVSRESATQSIRGQVRVDGLLSVNRDQTDELDSNQIAFLEANLLQPRSSFGVRLSFKRDTPNRDISSDITDLSQTASDTGASVTQEQTVDRSRVLFNPSYTYNLTRRTELTMDYSYTTVRHGLPSCEEAIRRFGAAPDQVFTVLDELDNFEEHAIRLSSRYRLSRISSVQALIGYARFDSEEELTGDIPFELKIADERCRNVLRNPRRVTTTNTARFSLGYERNLSPTLSASVQLGYYSADSDKFDENNATTDDTSGYLADITLTKSTGITQYVGRVGVEVFPSDVGEVVESLQVIGDVTRELSPRLDFTFRARAYEPDAIGNAQADNKFARRFISFEPKFILQVSRAWTAAASYRYRRQKAQTEPEPGQSHALLFSLKYTPPSEIRDLKSGQ